MWNFSFSCWNGEKWSRKNIFGILHMLIESFFWICTFDQNSSFLWGKSILKKMASTWRNFKNISFRPLFTNIFRPEILKFHPYSILTGDAMVGFVTVYCVQGIITKEYQKRSKNLVSAWVVAILEVVTLIKDCYKI